jgi:hypothetical protein
VGLCCCCMTRPLAVAGGGQAYPLMCINKVTVDKGRFSCMENDDEVTTHLTKLGSVNLPVMSQTGRDSVAKLT